MLTDVEISKDRNVITKEAYNRNSVMWNVKTKVIPVNKEQLEPSQNLSETPDKQTRKARNQATTKETAILGTANILREVLT
jgi:hypothetical protein